MAQLQILEDGNSEDDETRVSMRKKDLEVFVIRIVDRRIHQVIEQNIGPMICRIVKEKFGLAGERLLTRLNHHSGIGVQSSESRTLQLEFMDKLSLPVFTSSPIKGEGPTPLRVALVDATTTQVVTSGPGASAKVEIVVVEGDFHGDSWTLEEFNNKIVREKDGKKSLITGKVHLILEEGVGFVRGVSFTHNSHWMKACKLRLGAKVVDNLNGSRVREAVTEPFVLKDCRHNYTKKHFPPSLNDEVWRLKMISRDGTLHKRLVSENIKTVKDLLTRFFLDHQSLQNILGTAKMREAIDHARTCILDESLYLYFPIGSEKKYGVVFNVVGQVVGLISEGCYATLDKLSEDQKGVANNMVVAALERMEEVRSFADETHLHSYLQLQNDAYPPNSPRLESLSHYNYEPSDTYYGHDHPQTITSSHNNQVEPFPSSDVANPPNILSTDSLVIMPFASSFGNASLLNELDLPSIAAVDLINEDYSTFPGNFFDPPICYTECMSQTFCESQHLQLVDNDHSFQYQSSSSEAQDLGSIVSAFLSSRATAHAQRRWSTLSYVLRIKRKSAALKLVSSEAVLASKRPRIY